MSRDYPLFGVGLGNFREVSRQIYGDAFYRPPHNSYLWATSEGGVLVLGIETRAEPDVIGAGSAAFGVEHRGSRATNDLVVLPPNL